MFSNLQIRPAKPHRRKSSMATRSGVSKRRISQINTAVNDIPSMSFMEDLFGDEFPEAFTTDNTPKGTKNIADLPAELLAIIAQDLSKLDLKRLRLASRYLSTNVDLRIERLYVSPSWRNLECVRCILGHERWRFGVGEVVWDDAQLDEYEDLEGFRDAVGKDEEDRRIEILGLLEEADGRAERDGMDTGQVEMDDSFRGEAERDGMETDSVEDEYVFDHDGRLTERVKSVLLRRGDQASRDMIARYSVTMSVKDSYEIYQRLYREEQDIMKRQLDAAALRHVLTMCPNLERVTITSEVWRPWNFEPAYSTPFHRSLPPGFKKPSVWPWLGFSPHAPPSKISPYRNRTCHKLITSETGHLPHEYRGYTIVVSALISLSPPPSNISELIIYPGNELIGIGHQLFATPNADFNNTLTLAHTIPLTRLKFSLNSRSAQSSPGQGYISKHLQSGLMRSMFEALTHLEHLDFAPNCHPRRDSREDEMSISCSIFPCADVFPLELVQRLKTFALRNASVRYDALFDLICGMSSAQHITLDNVSMSSYDRRETTYAELARALRGYYEGAEREGRARPVWTVVEPVREGRRCRLVTEELNNYLYWGEGGGDGDVPFEEGRLEEQIRGSVGWVVDDRDLGFVQRVGGGQGW